MSCEMSVTFVGSISDIVPPNYIQHPAYVDTLFLSLAVTRNHSKPQHTTTNNEQNQTSSNFEKNDEMFIRHRHLFF